MSLLRALRRTSVAGLKGAGHDQLGNAGSTAICHPEYAGALKCFDIPSRANSLDPFPVSALDKQTMEESSAEMGSGSGSADEEQLPRRTPTAPSPASSSALPTPLPKGPKDAFVLSPLHKSPRGYKMELEESSLSKSYRLDSHFRSKRPLPSSATSSSSRPSGYCNHSTSTSATTVRASHGYSNTATAGYAPASAYANAGAVVRRRACSAVGVASAAGAVGGASLTFPKFSLPPSTDCTVPTPRRLQKLLLVPLLLSCVRSGFLISHRH